MEYWEKLTILLGVDTKETLNELDLDAALTVVRSRG